MRSLLLTLALAFPLPWLASPSGPLVGAWPGNAAPAAEPHAPQETPAERKGAAQDPAPDEDRGRDIFGRPRKRTAETGGGGGFQGCWRLVEATLEGPIDRGLSATGMLLVHDGFLALELHMPVPGTFGVPGLHQSLYAEYVLAENRTLTIKSLTGSYLDPRTGLLEWERNGLARDFRVALSDQRLTLSYGRTGRLSFVRQRSSMPAARDVFGRERADPVEERDIFGRPVGRRAPEPKGDGAPGTGTRGEGAGSEGTTGPGAPR